METAPQNKCPWWVEVPSGNPEPDFPSDMFMTVECGAPMAPDMRSCEDGHTFPTCEEYFAPYGEGYQDELKWKEMR